VTGGMRGELLAANLLRGVLGRWPGAVGRRGGVAGNHRPD